MAVPVSTSQASRVFEGGYCDDGYEFLSLGEAAGWRAISGWGSDGWDLGDWPYVVYLFRDPSAGVFERASYCEGDISIETYATAEDREAATDESALFFWKAQGEPWLSRPEADLRGPYSSTRSSGASSRG